MHKVSGPKLSVTNAKAAEIAQTPSKTGVTSGSGSVGPRSSSAISKRPSLKCDENPRELSLLYFK